MIICFQDQKLLVFFLHVVLSYYCIVMSLKNKYVRCNLAPKFFELHAWVKKCHFGNFLERTGMACPQKCIIAFENFFLFWVLMNIQKDWKAKLESVYSFMLKYYKITVCMRWCFFKSMVVMKIYNFSKTLVSYCDMQDVFLAPKS